MPFKRVISIKNLNHKFFFVHQNTGDSSIGERKLFYCFKAENTFIPVSEFAVFPCSESNKARFKVNLIEAALRLGMKICTDESEANTKNA